MTTLYRGFSTISRPFGPYGLTDNDLIVQDLLNNLSIRKGEKLMNPDFGCIVWDRLFDPLTEGLKLEIVTNVETIIKSDPRLAFVKDIILQESPDGHGILLDFTVKFAYTDQSANLSLKFDSQSQKLALL
jgi:phage baseplate assembly protein W